MSFALTPSEELKDHLKLREGFETVVYLDTKKRPTVGLGHLLTTNERPLYPLGSRIPDGVLKRFTQRDTQTAYNAALVQVATLGVDSQAFVDALTSVIFQLGPKWNLPESHGGKGFVHTWELMVAHKWEAAAVEVAKSDWAKEPPVGTPVRVKDFQLALRALIVNNDHDDDGA